MSKIFFTSDTHFWHANVIRYCDRPYSSVEEMNEALVDNWNSVVRAEDTIYHLGDFSLSRRAAETILPRLSGRKILVAGNHDHCHPAHYGKREGRGRLARAQYTSWGFEEIHERELYLPSLAVDGSGPGVLLCHMPYSGTESTQERNDLYLSHRPPPLENYPAGTWLLHGHVHQAWKVAPGKRMINVGVDVWGMYPVSSEVLLEITRLHTSNSKEGRTQTCLH